MFRTSNKICLFILSLLIVPFINSFALGNPPDNRVVFEGFYWDCKNIKYATEPDGTGGWYSYLTVLMPRLKDMGFDGVWTPPPCKANTGSQGMGYDLFDHYDIGQKFQCGARHRQPSTTTRFGDQDAFLRMIAVAHANGLEIYPDIVLNHCDGGAPDNSAPGDQFKKYRYIGFGGPERGRWPKDWWHFHPNPDHSWQDDDWRHILVGSDICYHGRCADKQIDDGGNDYMRLQARQWLIWFRRQTDIDGFRFDAVKHFPPEVIEDVLFNTMDILKPEAQQRHYFAVGEYVGTAEQLDNWTIQTNGRCGTFDFAFRQALVDMVKGGGYFDMRSLPNAQQKLRAKTVPFVNNHDTWRGVFSNSSGNGQADRGFDLKNKDELASTIDPDDPRSPLAYAAIMMVDGNPQVFYEDLFDNRDVNNIRDKQNPVSQPTRSYLENLIWCHQKLNFKDGPYYVRFQGSSDLLIIERGGKAIIALNDNGENSQGPQKITTSFGPNIRLHDYSGRTKDDISTDALGDLVVPAVPPMSYVVWGPAGIEGGFNGAHVRRTTHQFRLDDDLGDNNPKSLGYGGKLVNDEFRTAGAIWSAANKNIRISIAPDSQKNVELRVLRPDRATGSKSTNTGVESQAGVASIDSPLVFEFTAADEGYYIVGARLSSDARQSTPATISVEYEAPAKSDKLSKLANNK